MFSKSTLIPIMTAMCCLVLAQPSVAQTVELRSLDGLIRLRGEVIGYDGDKVQIDSSLGVVEVPSRRMVCLSVDCPQDVAWAVTEKNITVAVEQSEYQTMLDQLAQSYVDQLGGTLTPAGDDAFSLVAPGDVLTLNVDVAGPDAIAESDVAIKGYTADTQAELRFDNAVSWATDLQPARQVLAIGAMSVIVAPDVELSAITVADLARIYAGEITNWSELGGPDTQIIPLKREPESGAIRDFSELVMSPFGLEIEQSVLTVGSDERLVETVDQFPGSVAVVDWSVAESSTTLALSGQCGVDVTPSAFAITSGDYPLLRSVVVESQSALDFDMVPNLFDLAATSTWQTEPVSANFIDQSVTNETPEEKSARVTAILSGDIAQDDQESAREMVETLFGSNRLSVTFQDNNVTASIAAWNRASLVRLHETLQAYADTDIVFVGISMAEDNALAASRASAQEVMEAFTTFAPEYASENEQNIVLSSLGFGSLSPASCHDGPFSSVAGNRVEIWVRPNSE